MLVEDPQRISFLACLSETFTSWCVQTAMLMGNVTVNDSRVPGHIDQGTLDVERSSERKVGLLL